MISPRSWLRGSHVPVKGAALASVGKALVALSLKHAAVKLVATPPVKVGLLIGYVDKVVLSHPLNVSCSLSTPSLNHPVTHTAAEATAYSLPLPVTA